MLLDTPSLYFRAFYGVPESVRAPDGTPVNAVRGLLDMIAFLIAERRPARLLATMDADWRPQFRVDLVPSYKAHRVAAEDVEEVPDALSPQVPVIVEVLTALGFAVTGVEGYEADDVIGTVASAYAGPVEIVTGDRDLFQLVRDPDVQVLYTQKGLRNLLVVTESVIEEKYGIPGRAYADFALLRGDPSDGLPGVPGVGDKTAATLIARYGTVGALLEAASTGGGTLLSAAVCRKLDGARDYLGRAKTVVQVALDVPVPKLRTEIPREPADPGALVELCDRWNLDSPVGRLLAVMKARA
jgi:5'-3' exonuclease